MKDYLLGYVNVDFSFNTDISVRVPESGFLLQLGQTGADFYPVISFSGVSGYIFDQRGDFVAGYSKNGTFSISGNYDYNGDNEPEATGRLSYFLNESFIANNIYNTGFIDAIRFEGYSDDNVANISFVINTGDSVAVMSQNGYYFQDASGNYIFTS
jgi:hypothetical protein